MTTELYPVCTFGNDGPWSSFTLQIGTPAHDVRVLISTSGSQTWAVATQRCNSTDPPDCQSSQGNLFDSIKSTTWKRNNTNCNGTFALDLEENSEYSGVGSYGYDTIALDSQGNGGPSLDQQILAGITTRDFYLGIFGLDPRPSKFTDSKGSVPSHMTNLFTSAKIPSLAWGYKAGNQSRLKKVLGSLTLGGYDASRFIPNPVTFPFSRVDARALTISLQSITFQARTTTAQFC